MPAALRVFALALGLLVAGAGERGKVVFTPEQVASGETLYLEHCASCHGAKLYDGAASPLVGSDFLAAWRRDGRTLYDLYDTTRTIMPVGFEGTLTPEETVDLLAYMLEKNGYLAGKKPLRPEKSFLGEIVLAPPAKESKAPPARSQ